ncbi:TIM44-like domain-containing protein [Bradyrhizobium sp. 170]|uniref:Tim44 domain-containing protein n=1 Tax=Bradyrhizobium sp. 170 TaxID=2782641 RepID=UPI001FFFDEEE|nr:TIM44-like domain-containing protein [Bradyrhizobium sp. 170]
MNFTLTARGIIRTIAIVMSVAVPLAITISAADARVGGGGSSGSRGSKTYSAPPSTTTAPGAAQPMNRTFTQPGTPGVAAPAAAGAAAKGGFFNRPGMMGGMLGGLAMGFLGAGLFGMLTGGSLFSGLGGLSSIIGLLLQIALIVIVVRLAMSWWQRRHTPASASAYATGPAPAAEGPGAQTSFRSGLGGFGLGSSQPPLEIQPADYEAFERLLGEVQAAWSNEDVAKLHTLATPEMVSYFSKDLEENKARNDVNKVTDVKLLQGDLAEAWRESETDFASVAMRFSLVDKTTERTTGRLVSGSDTPIEATEVWTFARRRGSDWELSAIQQTS